MLKGIKVSAVDVDLFDKAVGTARESQARVRVGALLAKGRKPIVAAHNVTLRLYPQSQHFPGHAERRVINGQHAFKGTLYVARIDLSGDLAAGWPCPECLVHIKACDCVSKIVYYDGHTLVKVRI